MKFLDSKNDVVFRKIFGQHPEILKSFLNSMLPLQEGHEIVELSYLSPEMLPETFLEKFTSVDVRWIDNTGRQFLVEMQMNWTTAFKQRILINTSKAYVTQTTKGFEYRNLKPVYALNLINQNYLPNSPDYYHHYAVVHYKDSNEKLEGLEFVFIELEKFRSKNLADKKLQVLWLLFLTEINEQTETISEQLLENRDIKEAVNFVYEASLSKKEKLLYDKNWDRISSEKTILNEAKAEAKAEGIAEGKEKGKAEGRAVGLVEGKAEGLAKVKAEIAQKAKAMGMPIKDISSLTCLSEEEIEAL